MPTEDQTAAPNILVVCREESDQKLLRFLERRLRLPSALLHRWLRTGQIRMNGRRAKAFARVSSGDGIRLPPFAAALAEEEKAPFAPAGAGVTPQPPPPADIGNLPDTPGDAPFLSSIGRKRDIWALYKPPGLPTHGGTGHSDSLAARLAALYPDLPFTPTPAHRLDKDTSGLLLAAASYAALQELHGAWREGLAIKEYLAWVRGRWPSEGIRLLRHYLRKEGGSGFEKMQAAHRRDSSGTSREALCLAAPLHTATDASLLHIRLITGRTHQIRAQLAVIGYPVLGDAKYGSPGAGLRLHALRVLLPGGLAFVCPPPWRNGDSVAVLPSPMPTDEKFPLPF